MQNQDVTEEKIRQAVTDCLGSIGVPVNNCVLGVRSCRGFKEHGAGAYVFFDKSMVYYVGESSDIANRLREHCTASIGGSEGVVRFFMYYLDEICSKREEWGKRDAVGREDFVKDVLREKIIGLKIFVVLCGELADKREGGRVKNRLRLALEDCLVNKLRPALQQEPYWH